MKKTIAVFLLLIFPIQAFADESFWSSIRKKVENITPKKKLSSTTAAGGVRGALADSDDLYWKGEALHELDSEELTAFKNAVALFEASKNSEAKDAFNKFLKDYPASPLASDAQAAIAQLK